MTQNKARKAHTQPTPREDYLNVPDVARLLHVSPSRVRQWVRGEEDLPEPIPHADATFQRHDDGTVHWWRVERAPELIAWRRRCQALSSAKFLNIRRSKRGAPRVRTLDDIARAFLSQQPMAALGALAALGFFGLAPGHQMAVEESAVADQALALVSFIDDYMFADGVPGDAPNEDLTEVLSSVTTPRHVSVISQAGATNQLAYLLNRLGFTELTDRLHTVEMRRIQAD
jgi:hypothetical protein